MPRLLNDEQDFEMVEIGRLRTHPRNVNDSDLGAVIESIKAHGFYGALVVQRGTCFVCAGNHRLLAARQLGFETLPVTWIDCDEETALRVMVADNRTTRLGHDNPAALAELLAELAATETGLGAVGYDGDDLDQLIADLAGVQDTSGTPSDLSAPQEARRTLAERFGVPPFSVLDARQGYWQARKRAWIALGIQSELGRGGAVTPGDSPEITEAGLNHYRNEKNGLLGESQQARAHYAEPGGSRRDAATLGKDGKTVRGDGKGRALNPARCFGQDLMRGEHTVGEKRLTWVAGDRPESELDEVSGKNLAAQPQSGTSIFDPVLCELAYRWFCPAGGSVLDPFAGGSVRGVVASLLGRPYTGIDLRAEQIAANEVQGTEICTDAPPRWIAGDSANVATLAPGEYDLVFSCPPYADLEVYSDDPLDLSTMEYDRFLDAYSHIIAESVAMLRPNRFACFVVGDVRDKKGFYRNFIGDTVNAFQEAGATLYNEAILVTAVGSLPIRVGKQFGSYRKLGKTHQNVLVFYKGDIKKIPDVFGDVECGVDFEEAEVSA